MQNDDQQEANEGPLSGQSSVFSEGNLGILAVCALSWTAITWCLLNQTEENCNSSMPWGSVEANRLRMLPNLSVGNPTGPRETTGG